MSDEGEEELSIAMAVGAFAVVTLLFYAFFYSFLRQKVAKKALQNQFEQGRNKLIGKHRLSITPDQVTDMSEVGVSTTHWRAIEYVMANDQYLFMPVRASSPHIVPRMAFSDESGFKQFVETAKAYYQAAK